MRALAVLAVAVALVAAPAGAARDPVALVLQRADLPAAFAQTGARYRTNATTAKENDVEPSLLRSWGRVNGYEATFEREIDPSSPPDGPGTITSNVSLYRTGAGLRKAFAASVASVARAEGFTRRALPGRLGDEARLWETRLTESGLKVVVYTLVWRGRGALSHLAVAGVQGKLRPADVLALARRQQARVAGRAAAPPGRPGPAA